MNESLQDMTQERWSRMSRAERERVRDYSGLSPQLVGLEGWRVEVVSRWDGSKRRFIVGRSTGWRPCHIELQRRDSSGGVAADSKYRSVRKLYRVDRQ